MAARAHVATETIAAIATPAGRGGVAIVRISGPLAGNIAASVLGDIPAPRRAVFRNFRDENGDPLDSGLAIYFPAPASFTGEDILELHGHGGAVVADMLLSRVLLLGARLAQPGEFSRRAFLNDKLDLAQAEAIADLIDSSTTQAARAALRSLQGEFSAAIHTLIDAVTQTRMYVEAAIDFPEEEIDFLSDGRLIDQMSRAQLLCAAIFDQARQGALLRDGMTIVIAGKPNAGKSSLLNALAGHDAAIVTDIPGTTRDVLRERINLDGMPLHIADTAGLREQVDVVEAEGIRRAHQEMTRADRILYVIDAAGAIDDDTISLDTVRLPATIPVTLVFNKIDLAELAPRIERSNPAKVFLSAATGVGVDLLREHLKECAGLQHSDTGTVSARRRHLDALARTQSHLQEAMRQLQEHRAGELMAEELRQAQHCLGEITGEVSADDLLGKIFSSFCIGK
jgi:tRNA modification GTPase